MEKQGYRNHIRYYAPHHFVFLPLMGSLLGVGVVFSFTDEANRLIWLLFSLLSFCILYLGIMTRQHHALVIQDRVVRLEFRLRYLELFQQPCTQVERLLSFPQMAALRFANDEEFKSLLEQALSQNLSADDIKRSIQHWQADDMRV